jgi:hypothetical protein
MAPVDEKPDPVTLSLLNAPVDDEPLTEEDNEALEEADEDIRGGRVTSLEEVAKKLGIELGKPT